MRFLPFVLLAVVAFAAVGCQGLCSTGTPYMEVNLPSAKFPPPLWFGEDPKFTPSGYVQTMPATCAPQTAPVRQVQAWVPAAPAPSATPPTAAPCYP